jgi:hypothetical protein
LQLKHGHNGGEPTKQNYWIAAHGNRHGQTIAKPQSHPWPIKNESGAEFSFGASTPGQQSSCPNAGVCE